MYGIVMSASNLTNKQSVVAWYMRSAILGFIILFFAPVIRAQSFLYIQSYGDTLTAIPSDYIANYSMEADEAHIKLVTGVMLIVPNVERTMWDCPVEFPRFAYYRFNSKQNDQLFQSVAASPQELLQDTILSHPGVPYPMRAVPSLRPVHRRRLSQPQASTLH